MTAHPMTNAGELAERLEALDKLFADLWQYATDKRTEAHNIDDPVSRAATAFAALGYIKHSIGGRYNVIPEAAALLRSQAERIEELEGYIRKLSALPERTHYVTDSTMRQHPTRCLSSLDVDAIVGAALNPSKES